MIRLILAAFLSVAGVVGASAQTPNQSVGVPNTPPYQPPQLIQSMADLDGDSRTADAFVSINVGVQGGLTATNWIVSGNALANNPWQFNLDQAGSGCRSDEFLSPANILPMVQSQSGWAFIGYPIINNIGPQTQSNQIYLHLCTIPAAGAWTTSQNTISVPSGLGGSIVAGYAVYDSNNSQVIGTVQSYVGTTLTLTTNAAHASAGSADALNFLQPGNTFGAFPYTDNNGAVITLSTLATNAMGSVTAPGTIAYAVQQLVNAGKKVVLAAEPGNATGTTNTLTAVASGTATIAPIGSTGTGTMTVTACTSCNYFPNQILSGTSIASGTIIVSQTGGTPGGIGTYLVSSTSTVASGETILGEYSNLSVVNEFNELLKAFAKNYPGQVFYVDTRSALYSPTGSSGSVSFVSGVLIDGVTHFNNYGGYLGGTALVGSGIPSLVPTNDNSLASISDVNGSNPRELINNPLFQTTTGGAFLTCTPSGGNATPPSLWRVSCGLASTTVTVTTPTDAKQSTYTGFWPSPGGAPQVFGNDLQVVGSATTAAGDTIQMQSNAPSNNAYNLSDWLQTGALLTVTGNPTNCSVYGNTQVNTDAGTRNAYSVYGGGSPSGSGTNNGPPNAYTFPILTPPVQPTSVLPASTTKTSVIAQFFMKITGIGTCTVLIQRPSLKRVNTYSSAAGFGG